MSPKSTEPLRGEAAWKAAREAIAKKNDATCARGRRERLEREGVKTRRRLEAERADQATWSSAAAKRS